MLDLINYINTAFSASQLLLVLIKDVYNDIDDSVHRIQYELQQFAQIKEKIKFSRNILKLLFEEDANPAGSNKANLQLPQLKLNNMTMTSGTAMEGDSFEMVGDGVFCSTKLEIESSPTKDNTMMRRSFGSNDNTLVAVTTNNYLPTHTLELNTFSETTLQQLHCRSKERYRSIHSIQD